MDASDESPDRVSVDDRPVPTPGRPRRAATPWGSRSPSRSSLTSPTSSGAWIPTAPPRTDASPRPVRPNVWRPRAGRRTVGLLLVVALAGAFVAWSQVTAQVTPGQPLPAVPPPPFDLKDPGAVAEGRRLYHSTCTFYCHGREGR